MLHLAMIPFSHCSPLVIVRHFLPSKPKLPAAGRETAPLIRFTNAVVSHTLNNVSSLGIQEYDPGYLRKLLRHFNVYVWGSFFRGRKIVQMFVCFS